MISLEQDLKTKLEKERYFLEIELSRLASTKDIVYEKKVSKMAKILKKIAIINDAEDLRKNVFEQSKQAAQSNPQQTQQTHQGQSHGE